MMQDHDPGEPLLFDAVLYPHRSLSRGGFATVMLLIATISMTIGIGFWAAGAWPVIGFLGADVALVYAAFRLNYRSGRSREIVRLSRAALEVTRYDPWGRARRTVLEPAWLRVLLDPPEADDCRLLLSSHGQGVELGAFLAPEEKRDLAEALRHALAAARAGPANTTA